MVRLRIRVRLPEKNQIQDVEIHCDEKLTIEELARTLINHEISEEKLITLRYVMDQQSYLLFPNRRIAEGSLCNGDLFEVVILDSAINDVKSSTADISSDVGGSHDQQIALTSSNKKSKLSDSQIYHSPIAENWESPIWGFAENVTNGQKYPVKYGDNLVGRDFTADIRMCDLSVSKTHANVFCEKNKKPIVKDLGSTNGTVIAQNNSAIQFGDVMLKLISLFDNDSCCVDSDSNSKFSSLDSASVSTKYSGRQIYHASNFLVPKPPSIELEWPKPDSEQPTARFPIIAMIAPLIMGTVMFTVSQNLMTILFVALSPIMMLGNWLESKISTRKMRKDKEINFQKQMLETESKVELFHQSEINYYEDLVPLDFESPRSLVTALIDSGRLWSRRTQHSNFFHVIIGRAKHASSIPNTFIENCPLVLNLSDYKQLGVSGLNVLEFLNALIMQLVLLIPDGLLTFSINYSTVGNSVTDDFKTNNQSQDKHVSLSLPNEQIESSKSQADRSLITAHNIDTINASDIPQPASVATDYSLTTDKLNNLKWLDHFRNDHNISNPATINLEYNTDSGLKQLAIYLDPESSKLPNTLDLLIDLERRTLVDYVNDRQWSGINFWNLDQSTQMTLVHDLAKVVLDKRDLAEAKLPELVTYADLEPFDIANDLEIFPKFWAETVVEQSVPAWIGCDAIGSIQLDLVTEGPHCLIGGTTGSGKSEFLQSWILEMAVHSSPEVLNFLLIDYKGGSAFGNLSKLPHTVGLVIDLEPQLAKRVLLALNAEIRYRERLFYEFGVKDWPAWYKLTDSSRPNLARLIIAVDEFAAMSKELPEFIEGMIDLAQRGRSLGMHLILATQRPNGVINENIRANTDLRIALRVNDDAESNDIIGTKDAAHISPLHKGRLFLKSARHLIEVQSLYVNSVSGFPSERHELSIRNLETSLQPAWDLLSKKEQLHRKIDAEQWEKLKDANRIINQLCNCVTKLKLPAPRHPWLEVLPKLLTPEQYPSPTVICLDNPTQQSYNPLQVFELTGNLLLAGSSGTGKTELVRSIILNMLQQAEPIPTVILAENDELKDLLALHSVADLIMFDDHEKLMRLFHFVAIGDTRWTIVVENLNTFLEQYDKMIGSEILSGFYNALVKAETNGSQFIFTSTRPSGINNKVRAHIKKNLVLHLNSEMDYAALDIKREYQTWLAEEVPGRVLVNQLLGQTIYYDQIEQKLIESVENQVLPAANPLPTLPKQVYSRKSNPVFAQSYTDLSNIYFPANLSSSLIVVCGSKNSPKAKLITTLSKLLRLPPSVNTQFPADIQLTSEQMPSPEIPTDVNYENSCTNLSTQSNLHCPTNASEYPKLNQSEKPVLVGSRGLPYEPLIVPDIANLENLDQDEQMAQQIRQAQQAGQTVIVEWTIGNSTNNWQTLQTIKQADYICALNCHELDIQLLYSTPLPKRNQYFPPMRGYLIHQDEIRLVQFSEFVDH
ncbi:MAG: FHA domain-containing protein [Bifidobacteriaceae bacterium]|jgi:S-DNA-T family DNA segregation ATPase FtsK/SpoIIIE|nr:FHA domain-containing protein [Bifidobacteriaceae bacterium]